MFNQPCVAPFIGKQNVWDIPEKEWTPSVRKAILNAYIIGRREESQRIRDQLGKDLPSVTQNWQDPAKELENNELKK